jgi:hypothetical protein
MTKSQELELLQILENDNKFSKYIFCSEKTETTITINQGGEKLALEHSLPFEVIENKKHFKKSDLYKLFPNRIIFRKRR